MSGSSSVARRLCVCAAITLGACARPPSVPARSSSAPEAANHAAPASDGKRRVIVFVWDGLRPDSIDPELTPELARLRDAGVDFRNHHSVYPTLTMVNAAAIATGARARVHGFFGNYEYEPEASGENAKGASVDFSHPFFSEDHAILESLDAFYRRSDSGLLRVETLFQVAHAAHLRTAAIGKAGPIFLQDYREDGSNGVLLDENVVIPRAFALALQAAGLALPKNTTHERYPDGALTLADDNGDPTAVTEPALITLADGVTPDPRAEVRSPHAARNAYLMRVFLEYVLPKLDPELSMIWLRNPDTTEHNYGPGTPPVRDALRHQDQLLGELLRTLERLGRRASTDLLIASDHGHSSIGSDPRAFPPRALSGPADGHGLLAEEAAPGYLVSGDVRTADWLRRAGFPHVYDGVDCIFDPVLSGIELEGKPLYPTRTDVSCKNLTRTTTPSYAVPRNLSFADAIVIAGNGGSEFFYMPTHDPKLVRRLVRALEERAPFGALFVAARYGALPGTLPLSRIGFEAERSPSRAMPDLVASFDWDDTQTSAAAPNVPGTEHSSPQAYRGMHGSFSPIDVHNTLIAVGPDFRAGVRDEYPSSSLDLAPTLAALFGLALPHAEGRVLEEALERPPVRYDVERFVEDVGPVALAKRCNVDDPSCEHAQRGGSYRVRLLGQALVDPTSAHRFEYLDLCKVSRSGSKLER